MGNVSRYMIGGYEGNQLAPMVRAILNDADAHPLRRVPLRELVDALQKHLTVWGAEPGSPICNSDLLAERAKWYRDGCDGLEDRAGYYASGDLARDAAGDLETALAELVRLRAQLTSREVDRSAQREVAGLERTVSGLRAQLEGMTGERDAEREIAVGWEQQYEQVRAQLAEKDERIKELTDDRDHQYRHRARLATEVCAANDKIKQLEAQHATLTAETERELRMYLWLNHGHRYVYGDDGEMQCSECSPVWDYKRAPLEDVIRTAIASRREVNKQG